MRCVAQELTRVWTHNSHTLDETMLVVWLSQLIINMRPGLFDPAHNSATRPLFERYLATLFGCSVRDVWEVTDEWVSSLGLSGAGAYPPLREASSASSYSQRV